MFPPVYAALLASAPVTALIGKPARAYRHGDAPQGVAAPYVTWFVVDDQPENNLSDPPPADRMPVQVDCWADTDAGVETLAAAVRAALEPHAHMTGLVLNSRDERTRRYRVGLQFDWWLSR